MEATKDLNEDIRAWMGAFFHEDFIYACERFVDLFRHAGIKDMAAYHSGGGCCHFFIQDEDNYIHSLHNEEWEEKDDGAISWQCETSHLQWDSVHDYVDDENEKGFSWEHHHPNYEARQFRFIPSLFF